MKLDFYEINTKTSALLAREDGTTEIIEGDIRRVINKPAIQILKESCEYYGSTFEGRIQGSKRQLGMCYKLPITVEGSNELIFFPTKASTHDECSWISLKNIASYERQENNVIVNFASGQTELLELSYESLENQIFRATKLMLITRNRRNAGK